MPSTFPNFLVVGAARAGTTAFYHGLRQHPDIYLPVRKEPQFFTTQWGRGISWYASLYAEHRGERAVGDASNSYSYAGVADERTLERMRSVLGEDVRIVYLVREPVQRTYSHYLYYRHFSGHEQRAFEEAIEANPIYLGSSDYPRWIDLYAEAFGAERVHVEVFEDFKRDPNATYRRVFRFLGVEEHFRPRGLEGGTNQRFRPRSEWLWGAWRRVASSSLRGRLEARVPEPLRVRLRSMVHGWMASSNPPEPIDPSTAARLREHFAPMVREMERRLARPLRAWGPSERPQPSDS